MKAAAERHDRSQQGGQHQAGDAHGQHVADQIGKGEIRRHVRLQGHGGQPDAGCCGQKENPVHGKNQHARLAVLGRFGGGIALDEVGRAELAEQKAEKEADDLGRASSPRKT